jgi:hypothetical protein
LRSSSHAQRQQRMRRAALDRDERGQQRDAAGEEPERRRGAPAVGLGLGEPIHEREQPAGGRQGAGHVDLRTGVTRLAREQRERAERGGDREQQVHVQRPAPRQVLGQHAAEQQAHGAAAARDRAVDAERLAALAGVGEGGRQQRQRGRGQERAERALRRARDYQDIEALGGAADRRRGGEADQTGDQRLLAAEQVAELASDQQQAAERQRIPGDDPLASVVGEAQRLLRGG